MDIIANMLLAAGAAGVLPSGAHDQEIIEFTALSNMLLATLPVAECSNSPSDPPCSNLCISYCVDIHAQFQ
jgi:hypothetical protein